MNIDLKNESKSFHEGQLGRISVNYDVIATVVSRRGVIGQRGHSSTWTSRRVGGNGGGRRDGVRSAERHAGH